MCEDHALDNKRWKTVKNKNSKKEKINSKVQ